MGSPRTGTSMIRSDYLINTRDEDNSASFIYPHLQLNNVGLVSTSSSTCSPFTSKRHLLINDVSFEVRGGEIMAIMATSEREGTAILDAVAGKENPIVGDMVLNGQNVRARHLKRRVAYVQSDAHLCKEMTVVQTLRFHYDLKRPTGKLEHLKIDAMDRVSHVYILQIEQFLLSSGYMKK